MEGRQALPRLARLLRPQRPGKIRRLIALLTRFWDAIEADFFDRGWDLSVLLRQRRLRFIANIVEHLPRNSFFADAMAQDDELVEMNRSALQQRGDYRPSVREFGTTEELLAAVVDGIAQLTHLMQRVNAKKGHRPKPPKPWPRPETARDRAKTRWQMADVMDIVAAATPEYASSVSRALRQDEDPPEE